MKKITKLFVKAVLLSIIGLVSVYTAWGDDYSYVFSYGENTWTRTNFTDENSYYKSSSTDDCVASISGIFTGKTITSNVVITLNVATYGNGSNPTSAKFAIYNSENCSSQVTASQSGTLPSSSTYVNTIYTVTQSNAASFSGDLAIKVQSGTKLIRLKSIKVEFSYTNAGSSAVATTTTISAAGITNTDVYVSTSAGSLSATVKDDSDAVIGGATVSWSGDNDAVATINASTGAVTLVSAGTVTFTATYAGVADEYQASSDTYEMTVTSSAPYVQPTSIDITPNYAFWGKGAQFSGDTYDSLSGEEENVNLSWTRGSGSTYANASSMRFYKDNTLVLTAPTGYLIKSIVLTGSLQSDLSFDPSGFDSESLTWTGSSNSVTMSRPSDGSSYATISRFQITIGLPSSVATPVFSLSEGKYVGTQNVTISCSTDGATIYYTTDGTMPSESNGTQGTNVSITSTTTLKAVAVKAGESSDVVAVTYTIVPVDHQGTQADPYSVNDAYSVINAGVGTSNVYVAGTVSQIVTPYNGTYGNISYNISADGLTTGNQLQAYRGKSYNGDNFTSEDDIQVGDIVTIHGNLIKYNTIYEFAEGNQLVSLNRPVAPTILPSAVSVNATSAEKEGVITVTYTNIETSVGLDLYWYESDGTTPATYDWVVASINGDNNVEYLIGENRGAARTAYFKIYGVDAGANDVYSPLITISQEAFVPPAIGYAALPFAFNGGKSDITSTDGLTQSGLDSDYASAPKLKFNGADDYVLLHFNEAPGTLSFTIKGNGSGSDPWAGTFKVQASSDGSDYEDIATYTELGDESVKEISDLASNVRYIKWIYVTKTTGNVALGSINLTKPAAASTISLTGTLGADGHYYATFYSSSRYTLSEGATAYTMNSSNQLYRLGTDGSVVEDEAVIIISDSADITLTKSGESGAIAVHGGENILLGSDSPVASYTLPSGKKAIVLGVYSTTLGFYEFTGDGIPANKAYYLVNE